MVALVVGGVLAVLFVTVATSEPARIVEREPSLPWALPELDIRFTMATTTTVEGASSEPIEVGRSEPLDLFTGMLQVAVLAIVAVFVVRLARRAWQHRPELRWNRQLGTTDFLILDDVADAVIADADAQHTALRTGSARNAIVECWLRLETIVEAAGLEHDPTSTAAEFTAKVLARFDVDPAATSRFAALYREARFSSHAMDESHRQAAIALLDTIHAGLRRTSTTVGP